MTTEAARGHIDRGAPTITLTIVTTPQVVNALLHLVSTGF